MVESGAYYYGLVSLVARDVKSTRPAPNATPDAYGLMR